MNSLVSRLLCLFLALMLGWQAMAQNGSSRVKVIVIDAGHGGSAFPGAVYGGVKEKDLNLAVALKLGALIEKELPDVKVVYTRKSDVALGRTLNEDLTARANIANKAEGDFFISIHANAARNTSVYGAETIIMGESEKETRYNEDAIYRNSQDELIDMSDENTAAMVRAYIQNLQFTYGEYSQLMAQLMQSNYEKGGRHPRRVHRQLLKVLYATNMPSVLTELGFMTNAKELAFMKSEKGQNALARMLCNAVKEYVIHLNRVAGVQTNVVAAESSDDEPQKGEDSSNVAEAKPVAESPSSETTQPTESKSKQKSAKRGEKPSNVEGYTIQILASDKQVSLNDSQFKSYRGQVKCYLGSGALKYKYCYGDYKTQSEAQRKLSVVRKQFKGAFVVKYREGNIVK